VVGGIAAAIILASEGWIFALAIVGVMALFTVSHIIANEFQGTSIGDFFDGLGLL
jgi:hypothetical protein